MRQSLEPAANEIAMLYTTSSTTLTHDKAEATSKATIAGPYGIGGGPNWGVGARVGFIGSRHSSFTLETLLLTPFLPRNMNSQVAMVLCRNRLIVFELLCETLLVDSTCHCRYGGHENPRYQLNTVKKFGGEVLLCYRL
jgi:hypothetical protein